MSVTNGTEVRAASDRLRRYKAGEWWELVWPAAAWPSPTQEGDLHTMADAMLAWEDAVAKGEESSFGRLSDKEFGREYYGTFVEPRRAATAGTSALSLAEIRRVVLAVFDDQQSLFWHVNDAGRLSVSVDSSGLFDADTYGADFEEITPDNLSLLEAAAAEERLVGASLDYGVDAPTLFCCRVRKARPHARHYEGLNPAAVAMLNACGPERTEASRE